MLTEDEIRQMPRKQRKEYLFAETCQQLGIEREDVKLRSIRGGHRRLLRVSITFPNGISGDYCPSEPEGERFYMRAMHGQKLEFYDDAPADDAFAEMSVRQIKMAKHLKELEAEVQLLRANKMTLPLPVTDAIVPHLLTE